LGDITLVNEKEIDDFNWMVGGSPCQDFSVAGKGKGAVWTCKDCKDDEGNDYQYNPLEVHYTKRDKCPKCNSTNIEKTRSSLVVEWLRILNEKKPNVAIYENVKNLVGKKHKYFFNLFIQELHEYGYNTYWKVLNAKNYGIPQNRERVYLIIIKKELDNGKFKFPKGFDNGIRLKDILEKEVDEKYYISQDKVDKLIKQLKDKEYSNTVRIGNGIGSNNAPKILEDFYSNREVREYEEYVPTLRADRQGLKVVYGCSTRTRSYIEQPEQLEVRKDGLSNSITTVQKDSMALEISENDVNMIGLIGNNGCEHKVLHSYRIRKLIPLECWRLMGFDDEDFYIAQKGLNETFYKGKDRSSSQLYKMAGNSIVVDVLYYIYLELYRAMPYLFEDIKLGSFFSGIGAFEKAIVRLQETIHNQINKGI